MKRIDWIILIGALVVLIAAGVWYFLLRKTSGSSQSLPKPPTGGNSGSSAANPSGATSTAVDVSALPYGQLPLKEGDHNQLVALLQRALNYLGSNLTIDGKFGPLTRTALANRVGGATTVTREVALALANQVKTRNGDGADPLADYLINLLKNV